MRSELGTPDVRYLLVVTAKDTEYALERLESLDASLQKLVDDGAITGYDHAARYVPTAADAAAATSTAARTGDPARRRCKLQLPTRRSGPMCLSRSSRMWRQARRLPLTDDRTSARFAARAPASKCC